MQYFQSTRFFSRFICLLDAFCALLIECQRCLVASIVTIDLSDDIVCGSNTLPVSSFPPLWVYILNLWKSEIQSGQTGTDEGKSRKRSEKSRKIYIQNCVGSLETWFQIDKASCHNHLYANQRHHHAETALLPYTWIKAWTVNCERCMIKDLVSSVSLLL